MTTRQIFEFLTLMGYEVKQEKILNMIKKLSRNRFLLISYFSTEERKTSYVVVSLDKYGEQVARQRRVEYLSFPPFERIDEGVDCKAHAGLRSDPSGLAEIRTACSGDSAATCHKK